MNNSKQVLLSDLKIGEKAIVKKFSNDSISIKFFEIGIFPGIDIKIIFIAPFSGPFYIKYDKNMYYLIIRKNEAKCIFIKRIF